MDGLEDQPLERRPMQGRTNGRARGAAGRGARAGATDLTSRRKDGLMHDPPKLRVVGGQADAEEEQPHPEVAEFVRWFTSWWLTRGLELVAKAEAEERRAA